MISNDGIVKLSDYGMSAILRVSQYVFSFLIFWFCLSYSISFSLFSFSFLLFPVLSCIKTKKSILLPLYISPEVIKGGQCTNSSDIWSLGITTLELAEGSVFYFFFFSFFLATNSTDLYRTMIFVKRIPTKLWSWSFLLFPLSLIHPSGVRSVFILYQNVCKRIQITDQRVNHYMIWIF